MGAGEVLGCCARELACSAEEKTPAQTTYRSQFLRQAFGVESAVGFLGLGPEVAEALQEIPTKGSLDSAVPVDPLIYRLHEITQVYGTTIKALIHEMFGDGIMSAIDFEMDIQKKADPKGDRVVITMNGKFLPYKKW